MSCDRIKLRIKYSRETGKLFSDNIPLYADWLEKKLSEKQFSLNKCKNCGCEFETKFKVMYCSKECAHGIKK